MKKIKIRQVLFSAQTGKFLRFHMWGTVSAGEFNGPVLSYNGKEEHNLFSYLKDKNKKDIFENDVIVSDRNERRPHVVRFIDGKFVGVYGTLQYDISQELYRVSIVGHVYKQIGFNKFPKAWRK